MRIDPIRQRTARFEIETLEPRLLLDASTRNPVLIVPGILGSLTPDIALTGSTISKPFQIRRIGRQMRDFLLEPHPYDPRALVPERISHAYDDILDQFEQLGFHRCIVHPGIAPAADPECDAQSDLFFAAYDWRLPILVNPANPAELLWDSSGPLDSGVEYLDWWIDLAKSKWIERTGSANGFAVDIVAHSMGGLVARSYVQQADDAGETAEPVDHLVMLGTPNHGSVAIHQYWNPNVRLFETLNLGCSSFAALADAVLGDETADPCFRDVLRDAMVLRDRKLHLHKGTSLASDLVPSLRDLLPTFPYLRRLDETTRVTPATNYLLERLNTSINELVSATDVTLVGTSNRDTAVAADIVSERSVYTGFRRVTSLRFLKKPIGDARVIFDEIPGNPGVPTGLALDDPRITTVELTGVLHGNLARNDAVICTVFDQLAVTASSCT